MLKNIALNTIKNYTLIEKNDKIVVGVSGGADSVSLLHFLKDISNIFNLSLTAVHINHNIRKEAILDQKFVENFCKNLSIPLEIFNIDIPKEAKKLSITEEEAGRIFRYKSFNNVIEKIKANKIAVAHNKNDNAETLLLNLFRGSGLKGLSSIPYRRENIIRPLLDCDRKFIENYCIKNNLKYVIDSTNNLNIYTRNKIRLDLIPYLEDNFNKNIISTLSNTANNLKEEESFLNNLASKFLKKVTLDKNPNFFIINIELLKTYDIVLIKRIVRMICMHFNHNLANISSKHLNMIIDLLYKQSGKSVNLPSNISFKKEHDTFFVTNLTSFNFEYNYSIKLEEKIFVKESNMFVYFTKKIINDKIFTKKVCTIALNYDNIKNNLILRNRLPGDKIFLNKINNYKKLKDLFIDLKIPYHKRSSIPILINEKEVIAVLGLEISDLFKANKTDDKVVYIHYWEE